LEWIGAKIDIILAVLAALRVCGLRWWYLVRLMVVFIKPERRIEIVLVIAHFGSFILRSITMICCNLYLVAGRLADRSLKTWGLLPCIQVSPSHLTQQDTVKRAENVERSRTAVWRPLAELGRWGIQDLILSGSGKEVIIVHCNKNHSLPDAVSG
jgi:hypothetical protein